MPEAAASVPYDRTDALRQVVRKAMVAGGLGQTDPARPLADIILPGMSVLLKPNWVLHENRSGRTMDCMVTHPVGRTVHPTDGWITSSCADPGTAGLGAELTGKESSDC
jgi:hypothetical protein